MKKNTPNLAAYLHLAIPLGFRTLIEDFKNDPINKDVERKVDVLIQCENQTIELSIDDFLTVIGFKLSSRKKDETTQ